MILLPAVRAGQGALGCRGRRGRFDRADRNVAVIGDQLDAGAAAAYLAGHALAFAGAGDRQVQLGLDVPVPGGGLQLKACALGHGQVDGAIAVVDLQLPPAARSRPQRYLRPHPLPADRR